MASQRPPTDRIDEIAAHLFAVFVLEDESVFMVNEFNLIRSQSGFSSTKFERQRFVYLAATVAVALTEVGRNHPVIHEVIPGFRALVSATMFRRWHATDDEVDAEIQMTAGDYAALLFTNPAQDRGLSFDWARKWILRVGVDEVNPLVLFQFSHGWKARYLTLSRFLSETGASIA